MWLSTHKCLFRDIAKAHKFTLSYKRIISDFICGRDSRGISKKHLLYDTWQEAKLYSVLLTPTCKSNITGTVVPRWVHCFVIYGWGYNGRHCWHSENYCSVNANLEPCWESKCSRMDELSARLLWTSNAYFLNILGEALPCSKAYLFPPGRCSLARLVKPETVDQIFSQAHCAAESFWMWLG